MPVKIITIISTLWILVSTLQMPAQAAVELTKLYQGQVQVSGQSSAERETALQQALEQTLLKVSGDNQLLTHNSIKSALQNVRKFVVQYGYQQEENQLALWVQFDQPQIDLLIQQAGSGIWSNLRPELMLWLVAEDESLQRQLLGSGDESVFMQQLKNTARTRGLPIQLPLLDLNDTMAISTLDVWARFDDNIDFATARYNTDGTVVARIYQTDPNDRENRWMVDWTLRLGELRWSGEVRGLDRSTLGHDLIADLTQVLAERYRIGASSGATSAWSLQVRDIQSVEQAIEAEQLLLSLPSVAQVQLIGFGNMTAEFELAIQADPRQIMQAIDLSKKLRPITTGVVEPTRPWQQLTTEPEVESGPVYRWVQP